jgi:hypothetical protein
MSVWPRSTEQRNSGEQQNQKQLSSGTHLFLLRWLGKWIKFGAAYAGRLHNINLGEMSFR